MKPLKSFISLCVRSFGYLENEEVSDFETKYYQLLNKKFQVKNQLEKCKQPIKFCNYFCENYGDDPRCGQCKGKGPYRKAHEDLGYEG